MERWSNVLKKILVIRLKTEGKIQFLVTGKNKTLGLSSFALRSAS